MPAPERRSSSALAAWVLAAVATTLAVVFAVIAVQSTSDLGRMPGHGHGGMAWDDRGHTGMSRSMMATSEEGYLVEMIAHHEDAVTAATELRRSSRPQMRELGGSIVTSQSAQIASMRSWLERWYDDAGPASYVPMMSDLGDLTGDDLDRTFLQEMVMHHHMAVMMSRHLLAGGEDLHPEVAELARLIDREQRAEIGLMERWLAEWFGASGRLS